MQSLTAAFKVIYVCLSHDQVYPHLDPALFRPPAPCLLDLPLSSTLNPSDRALAAIEGNKSRYKRHPSVSAHQGSYSPSDFRF